MYYAITRSSELYHYGVKGQKHGVRRYQNEDGSLTAEGRDHYGIEGIRGEGGANASAPQGNTSFGGRVKSFAQRHKKGLAITGGVLAAGLAAVAVSKVVGSRQSKNGQETVARIIMSNKKQAAKPGTSLYSQLRQQTPAMNRHVKIRSTSDALRRNTEILRKNNERLSANVAKAVKRNVDLMAQFDRLDRIANKYRR